MQRLFSTFPDGWPGFGLLLLRLGTGVALVGLGSGGLLRDAGEPIALARDLVEAAGSVLLLAGLWTPIAGAVLAVDESLIASSLYLFHRDGQSVHMLLAFIAAGIAMLGPGAWSIDARIFGRRRLEIRDRDRPKK